MGLHLVARVHASPAVAVASSMSVYLQDMRASCLWPAAPLGSIAEEFQDLAPFVVDETDVAVLRDTTKRDRDQDAAAAAAAEAGSKSGGSYTAPTKAVDCAAASVRAHSLAMGLSSHCITAHHNCAASCRTVMRLVQDRTGHAACQLGLQKSKL